ncbi:nuclear factor NF-kappa-B p110 subunit isoform X3 [Lutzomyia longipalpis]|uniref:nuclear factor NF-kappa-B p110 subunit isoform X3 n=1 Tax=Lutzomyia longipalpis TaxID=7200 RepID=UPI0024841F7D|nr:nuclear factor NF-kappa-B p110 subunit isoform X3 [Lutzomyia longipalpis]
MTTIFDLDSQRREVIYDSTAFTPSPLSNSSTSDGSEATYIQGSHLEVGQLTCDMDQRLQIEAIQTKPYLIITHQPVDKFRFRYKSEMHGSHGCLVSSYKDRARKYFPTAELRGFNGEAIIRCSLYQADTKQPHSHKLVVRNGDEDNEDPHDVEVGPGAYQAEFKGMGIIHTAKKNIVEELYRKLKTCEEAKGKLFSERDDRKLREIATKEEKNMNLNQVRLCFEAFAKDSMGALYEICEPVFSIPINNMKSALTGELKIARMSSAASSVNGGEDLFLFVEKVNKKNIKVRFYEENDDGQIVWESYGHFTEIDVHHQYGIALTTPEYHRKDIKRQVDVWIQLERPSDNERSEPMHFTYKPCLEAMNPHNRKRLRPNESFNSSDIPVTVNQMEQLQQQEPVTISMEYNEISISGDFLKHFETNSDEYKRMVMEANPFQMQDGILVNDSPKIAQDRKRDDDVKSSHNACLIPKDNVSIYETILSIVRQYGNTVPIKVENIVQHLLMDSKRVGENLLHWAIRENGGKVKNILEIVHKFNLNDYLDVVNAKGENCLHITCALDKAEYIRPLINLGANPNARDINGNTPLHVAVAEGRYICLSRIIDRTNYTPKSKALDINLANHQGMTALHLAVKNHDLEATRRLVEAGASVKMAEHKHGNSILHIAVSECAVDIVKFLLQKANVQVNQTNSSGYTALHLACATTESYESKQIVKLLLENKADPLMVNEGCVQIPQTAGMDMDEDEADMERARNSFELAQNKPEILTVLQSFQNFGGTKIKEEIVEHDAEEESRAMLLDSICSKQLCDLLNEKDLWKQLAMVLDQTSQISICERSANPAKTLFNVIEMQDTSVEDLIRSLNYLKLPNAVACVQEMLARRENKNLALGMKQME